MRTVLAMLLMALAISAAGTLPASANDQAQVLLEPVSSHGP